MRSLFFVSHSSGTSVCLIISMVSLMLPCTFINPVLVCCRIININYRLPFIESGYLTISTATLISENGIDEYL